MSTTPSKALHTVLCEHERIYGQIPQFSVLAFALADSEARAVEAALHGASVDGLTLCGCKDHPHRKDLSCCKIRRSDGTPLTVAETFAALTAERERVRVLEEESREFRIMLAVSATGMKGLYHDDGELQDTSAKPWIDWKRDTVAEIQAKLTQRNLSALAATSEHAKEGSK